MTVKFFTLTLDTLKQIRGHHGCINYKCPICRKEIDENDIGQTIVSLIYLNKDRINPNKQKQFRDYVHKRCYEGLHCLIG